MSTITPGVVTPASAPFNVTAIYGGAAVAGAGYSGTFIPTLWSARMNIKFYTATVFGEIANTDYEGDVKDMGDKVIINNVPDIVINNYSAGTGLNYQVPTPNAIELTVNKAKYFAFQCNDVLAYQSKPKLMDTFSNDAAMQMKISVDSDVIYNTAFSGAAANKGTAAGVRSGSFNLGSDAVPINMNGANVLATLMAMAGVLDEQNVPETDRWLLIDPVTRQTLLQSPLAQAQFMGDSVSAARNGKIGVLDRFTVYVTNNLPRGAAGTSTPWYSGDGSDQSIVSSGTVGKRRVLAAGHRSALTFVSQMSKLEPVRNPNDFGDFIRGLNVYGYKVIKPEALTCAIVQ